MKTKLTIVKVLNIIKKRKHIGCTKIYRNPDLCIGERYRMNINVDIRLTEEQLKQIEKQAKVEIEDVILSGKLESYIKEVIKSQIKSIVNEEIQTKNYRAYISKKVQEALIDEGFVSECDC